MLFPRTWAEVSLPNLVHNFKLVGHAVAGNREASNPEVLAIVKADAYGHGATACAMVLQKVGATWFAVTSCDEGVLLRDAGITARILLMSGFFPSSRAGGSRNTDEATCIVENSLTSAVWNAEQIRALDQAALKLKRPPSSVAVHFKVDTGMGRLGALSREFPAIGRAAKSAKAVFVEGIFSHLASSELLDSTSAISQFDSFEQAIAELSELGIRPKFTHIANSAAIFTYPESSKRKLAGAQTLVRPGLSLYGYLLKFHSQGGAEVPRQPQLKPVLSWKSRILSIKDVPGGQGIGYGGAYVTKSQTKIAVLPVGYADGLNRKLSSKGKVLVRGEFVDIIGNVSMDLTTIDVTGIPNVRIADEVVLIGEQAGRRLTAWDHADWAQTIPYEVLCAIGKRVPRIFKND